MGTVSVSFIDEQEDNKIYMSYDIGRSKLSKQDFDNEKWNGYILTKITDNFFVDDSLSNSLKQLQDISKNFKKADEMKGRGESDSGRSEPNYEGVMGYIAIGWREEEIMRKSDNPSIPCTIPIYQKTSSGYSEIGSVDNNTVIGVISQKLTHSGWGNYDGYLYVQDKDGELFYIDVDNFVTKPYFDY